jgi:hypothetical protein
VEATVRDGLLEVDGDAIRLTRDGRLLASEALVPFVPASDSRVVATSGSVA